MSYPPDVWLSEFYVADLPGSQGDAQITQLADGRIIVA